MEVNEILEMTDKELAINAAELMGIEVVHNNWPCGYPPESCGLEAESFPIKGKDGWTTDTPQWYDEEWPVTRMVKDTYWPPEYHEDYPGAGAWYTHLDPIKDYANEYEAAFSLIDSLAEDGIDTRIRIAGGETTVELWTSIWMEALRKKRLLYQWKEGDSTTQAITRAFIIQKTNGESNECGES